MTAYTAAAIWPLSSRRPASIERLRASVLESFSALGETSTAVIALFPDVSDTRTNVGESATAVGESPAALGERHADVIPRFTNGTESSSDIGETLTDAGQKLFDRAFPFAEVGKKKNAVASPPFAAAPGCRAAGLE